MNLQTLAYDQYQATLIMGIKLNALLECLTEEQKAIYQQSMTKQVDEMKEKLEGKENTDEILEILRSLHGI